MKNISTSPILSLFISFALLIAPLPITALAEDLDTVLSDSLDEQNESAIYLGNNISNIIQVITAIKKLDPHKNTLLDQLLAHIKEGFLVADYDAVFDTLEYAENVLHENSNQLSQDKAEQLFNDFEMLTDKIFDGELDVNLQDLENGTTINQDLSATRAHLRTLNIKKHLTVRGKGRFRRHLHTREGISAAGRLTVGKQGHFKRGVNIDGTLSVHDAVIGSLIVSNSIADTCMNNLCVNQLSVTDAFINNASINNLSIASSVVDSIMNHLTIAVMLSSHDAVVTHATVGTLSATDAIVDNLTVTNCIPNLCVNNLSTTNQSVSGTLSVTNEIINGNLRLTALTPTGVMHNDAAGNVSSSLITNADVSPSAAIADTKLATISTANKVANSATSATSASTPNTIVLRNGSGGFSAGTVSFTDAVIGNLTTTTSITEINITNMSVLDASITNNLSVNNEFINGNLQLSGLTTAGVLHNDASGNISSSLIINTDVSPSAAIADTKLATISTANKVANSATSATSASTPNTIVLRNGSGGFSAGSVSFTDAVIGNLTTITPITNINITNMSVTNEMISGMLSVNNEIINGNLQLSGFTTAGVLHNDTSGHISSSLITNADIALSAAITDTKLGTISTANKVANSATSATSANTPNTIVLRNGSGGFSAGAVSFTDAVIGNLTTTTPITDINITNMSVIDASITNNLSVNNEIINGNLQLSGFTTTGVLHNDTSGNISSSLIINTDISPSAAIADTKLATISTANKVANSATSATSANTPNTIVLRNGSGGFSAGAVSLTDAVIGNLTTTTPISNVNITNMSVVDASITNNLSVNNEVINGNLQLSGFTTTGILHNDTSGNISSSLIINADVSPSAAIADTKLATISTANKVANSATSATSANTPNTIVLRDGSGNFSAGAVSFTDAVINNLTTTTPIAEINITNMSVANEIISGNLQLPNFSSAGVLHNDTSGNVSSSLIINADVSPSAAIADTKLATISTANKVANSATSATSANTPNTIVLRDGSGNFSAGAVSFTDAFIGNLTTTNITEINITNMSVTNEIVSGNLQVLGLTTPGVLHNDSSGNVSSSLIIDADVSPSAAIADTKLATINTTNKVANSATSATSSNTPNTIVLRDGSGNFSAGAVSFTDAVIGNLTTTTPISNINITNMSVVDASITNNLSVINEIISGNLQLPSFSSAGVLHNDTSGNVSSSLIIDADVSPSAAIADIKLATISTANKVANSATSATSANTPNTIVLRDSSGNFSAGTVSLTDAVIGNLTTTTAISNINITNMSVVNEIISGNLSVNDEVINGNLQLPSFTSAGVLHNDTSGNVLSSLIINADISPSAAIADTKLATISTTNKVANSATSATSTNTPNTIVLRDGFGNFSAGAVSFTDAIIGNLTTTTAISNINITNMSVTNEVISGNLQLPSFTSAGVLHNNASGNISSSLVVNADIASSAAITDTKLATISTANKVANSATSATSANVPNTIVLRNGSGGFSAGTVSFTDAVIGNLTTTTTLVANFSGSLIGDVTGTQTATVVSSVGGQTAANIAAGAVLANAATSANTLNTIVKRDASGNFIAGTITANLIGNVTGNITGSASLNVLKAGDTMTGTLILPAGTAAAPSLQFTGSTNTGICVPVTNTLSFDTNGVERMAISTTGISLNLPLALTGPLCNQAIQVVVPPTLSTVTANPTTSVLIVKPSGILPVSITLKFPASPVNGQYFSVVLGSALALTLINDGNGALISNGLTVFGFGLSALSSATYIYYAPDNTWYTCG